MSTLDEGEAVVKPAGLEMSRIWPDGTLPGIPDNAPPPTASFTYAPNPAAQTQTVTFDGSASAPGEADYPLVSWDWLMDNSATRSGVSVTWRTPNGGGERPVVLTVTASDGKQGSQTQVLVIP